MNIIEAAAQFAKANYPSDGIAHIREMLYYCDLLSTPTGADREILIVATYLHDIAAHLYSWEEHDIKSAEMARNFLQGQMYPKGKTEKVIAAIMAHRVPRSREEAAKLSIEEKVLYDADKLAHSMGIGIALALIKLGSKAPGGKGFWSDIAAAIQASQIDMEDKYKSLYTSEAKTFARQTHENSRAYCKSLLALVRLNPSYSIWDMRNGKGSRRTKRSAS